MQVVAAAEPLMEGHAVQEVLAVAATRVQRLAIRVAQARQTPVAVVVGQVLMPRHIQTMQAAQAAPASSF